MNIAIDIPAWFAPVWKIAAGALEYATWSKDVTIIMHRASIPGTEYDPDSWDAAIVTWPQPDLDIPQVSISAAQCGDSLAAIVDQDMAVKLAVDQFHSMGLMHLAFFGTPRWEISKIRWASFSKQVENLGGTPVFMSHLDLLPSLSQIKKPCGILAVNDEKACALLDDCKSLGFRVPGDVHIISMGDMPVCVKTTPTLSSIVMPFATLGFEAAALCAKMIKGLPVDSIKLPPSGLIIRDSIKIENNDLRTATEIAHYLRMNMMYPLQMEDIVRRSSLSRRHITRVFTDAYGAAPIAYLKELRLDHAKKMLQSGDVKLKDVAEKCGYRDANHLCRTFRERIGLSPQAYAKKQG